MDTTQMQLKTISASAAIRSMAGMHSLPSLSQSYIQCNIRKLVGLSTAGIDCLGRFVSEMTYYVSSGTLNLTKPKPKP